MNISCLSSCSTSNKPFQRLPLSNRRQLRRLHVKTSISCRATKIASSEETINGDFYKILSLSPKDATMADIKRAYRSMARQYHPDVCRDPSMKEKSTRMVVQLNAAYETLSNPALRAEYDSELLGFGSRNVSVGGVWWRSRWQEQVAELKRRPVRRASWGGRMRARNNLDYYN